MEYSKDDNFPAYQNFWYLFPKFTADLAGKKFLFKVEAQFANYFCVSMQSKEISYITANSTVKQKKNRLPWRIRIPTLKIFMNPVMSSTTFQKFL